MDKGFCNNSSNNATNRHMMYSKRKTMTEAKNEKFLQYTTGRNRLYKIRVRSKIDQR